MLWGNIPVIGHFEIKTPVISKTDCREQQTTLPLIGNRETETGRISNRYTVKTHFHMLPGSHTTGMIQREFACLDQYRIIACYTPRINHILQPLTIVPFQKKRIGCSSGLGLDFNRFRLSGCCIVRVPNLSRSLAQVDKFTSRQTNNIGWLQRRPLHAPGRPSNGNTEARLAKCR